MKLLVESILPALVEAVVKELAVGDERLTCTIPESPGVHEEEKWVAKILMIEPGEK